MAIERREYKVKMVFETTVTVQVEPDASEAEVMKKLDQNFSQQTGHPSGGAWIASGDEEEGILDWDADMKPKSREITREVEIKQFEIFNKYGDSIGIIEGSTWSRALDQADVHIANNIDHYQEIK